MPFKKGQSGNPNGRKAGSTNKSIEGIRGFFKDFVEKNIEEIQDNFDTLTEKERLQFLLDISEYVLPKLSRQEVTGKDGDALPAPVIILNDGNKPISESN